MKAIIFVAKGTAAIEEIDKPVCPPGHLLCQTVYSGLTNGTERNVLMGGNYGGRWPVRLGYQNVGQVVEADPGAQGYVVGDWLFTGNFKGHVAFFTVDVSDAESPRNLTIRLHPAIQPAQAALFGMASVAMHDVRRAGVALGERVLVIGAGCIGLFTAQVARAAGARVTVCDLDAARLQLAQKLGAQAAILTADDEGWAAVKAQGPFDAIFEDSGGPVLDRILAGRQASGLLRSRGRLVLIAGRETVSYNFNSGQNTELTILQAGHFERSDLLEVQRLVLDGLIQVAPLIQTIVPIAQALAIYERLRDQPNSLLGTVYDWGS
jgi:2-desacetyl-2-hydroxyethyl bacteriochlorophyllide A dehydrogenase